ncbi:MAG TPA: hypothetical protein VHV82_02575 [Sporichthyaceae bacterium]|jgi:hypothetical protein|nr:hypothetical protein [Sporichthyaceae bacterium]
MTNENRVRPAGVPGQRRSPGEWDRVILPRAAEIVESYDIPVTLRQLHYRLVSLGLIRNTKKEYDALSERTAELRRDDLFPELFDRGRDIEQSHGWTDTDQMLDYYRRVFRLRRTTGQEYQIWLGVEKNALAGLLSDWFDELGLPVVPLGGYSSESLDRKVRRQVEGDDRPAVLIIAGDFDASGEDISRNFVRHTDCWADVTRIGLEAEQVEELGLIVQAGKCRDSRAPAFIDRYLDLHADYADVLAGRCGSEKACPGDHGPANPAPVQVELDAVEPLTLRGWFQDQIDIWWDDDVYQQTLADEEQARADVDAAQDWLRDYQINRETL